MLVRALYGDAFSFPPNPAFTDVPATHADFRYIQKLKELGVTFMTAPPETYYKMLAERLPGHGEPAAELQKRGILLDGTTEGGTPRLLLQIFAQPEIGPVFFEFIQRRGDEGFGEGNFKALFESIERDQIERGVLEVAE